jgi:hypothetical protein
MQVFYTINTNPFHVLVNMNNNQIAKLIFKREFRAYICGLITGLTTYGLLVNPQTLETAACNTALRDFDCIYI